MVLTAVRGRTANPFAMLMVVVLGVSLALSFLTGDARLMLMKSSITAAAVGITFLVMAALGHPLTLDAAKIYEPEKAEWRSEQFRTNPAVRHGYRTVSVVWGAGLLIEVIVLVPLIYLLPIDIMVAVDTAVGIGFLGALIGWTGWYQKQAKEPAKRNQPITGVHSLASHVTGARHDQNTPGVLIRFAVPMVQFSSIARALDLSLKCQSILRTQ